MPTLLDLAVKHLRGHHWSQEDAAVLHDLINSQTAGNVVRLDMVTKEPVPVQQVLLGALREHMRDPFETVLIIGMRGSESDDQEVFFTSESNASSHLYDMERFKRRLMWEADQRVSKG